MSLGDRVSIPLLAQLIPGGAKPGTIFTVEFDPDAQWLAVATTIAAKFLLAGGRVSYSAYLRSPETVRESLLALGVDISEATSKGRFVLDDWYSATLAGGRLEGGGASVIERIEGGTRYRSLKVSDLSVELLRDLRQGPESGVLWENWPPGAFSILDSMSQMLRFNEEKPILEWVIGRSNQGMRRTKRVAFLGLVRGIHSESFYKQFESDADGIIELRVMERDGGWKNLLCIRSLKGQPHDARWHDIEIKPNGEAVLTS